MGRSGGGGGGHIGGGHKSHHSSSHVGRGNSHAGHGGSHSGFGFNRSGSNSSGGYRTSRSYRQPHYHSDYDYERPVRRRYASSYRRVSSSSSCLGTLITVIIVFIILAALSSKSGLGGDSDFSSALPEYANKQYEAVFDKREDGLLIVITEDDLGQAVYGHDAARIMDKYVEPMWKEYDNNYDDDLGQQLGNMFSNLARTAENNNVEPVKSAKSFDSKCFVDNLNWVDSKSYLVDGAEEFYDSTGIQPYVMLVTNKAVKKETSKTAGVMKAFAGVAKTFIIGISIIVVLVILFIWWKKRVAQKNKEQEDLERTLNIPLDTFGTQVNDLEEKYDDMSTDNTSDTTTKMN